MRRSQRTSSQTCKKTKGNRSDQLPGRDVSTHTHTQTRTHTHTHIPTHTIHAHTYVHTHTRIVNCVCVCVCVCVSACLCACACAGRIHRVSIHQDRHGYAPNVGYPKQDTYVSGVISIGQLWRETPVTHANSWTSAGRSVKMERFHSHFLSIRTPSAG